jgi:hypothetical protein
MCSSEPTLRRVACRPPVRPRGQRGAAAVEFALVVTMFVATVLATIDLSRWVFAIVSAGEAARAGARTALVCSLEAGSAVRARMAPWLNSVQGGVVSIQYLPSGCTARQSGSSPACTGVSVSVRDYTAPGGLWLLDALPVPAVTAYLPRESLDSTLNPAQCS